MIADGERVYVITLTDGSLTHLPVWMTEATAAEPTTLTASPCVSVEALDALQRLLTVVLDPPVVDVEARGRR